MQLTETTINQAQLLSYIELTKRTKCQNEILNLMLTIFSLIIFLLNSLYDPDYSAKMQKNEFMYLNFPNTI